MKKEEALFLNQLVVSLAELEIKLRKYHEDENYESFSKTKRVMLKIQKEIADMLK